MTINEWIETVRILIRMYFKYTLEEKELIKQLTKNPDMEFFIKNKDLYPNLIKEGFIALKEK